MKCSIKNYKIKKEDGLSDSVPFVKNFNRYGYSLLLFLCIAFSLTACKAAQEKLPVVVEELEEEDFVTDTTLTPTDIPLPSEIEEVITTDVFSWMNETGQTLETRINVPAGYWRVPSTSEEFTGFLRELPLKEAGSKVLLYDGHPIAKQSSHVAVFDLDLGDRDLQQCADSVIRVYAEYYWSLGAYDKIAFHLTNGFLMEYTKWRDGNRIVVNGNDVRWAKSASYDDSYEAFRNYLTMVFAYAGTLSLSDECESITPEKMLPGDLFLQGGSPGHCVLIIDVAEDKDGKRCYLLAQGFMPAQDFHVITNPLHQEDPWYYDSEITFPLQSYSWIFDTGSLVRWADFSINETNLPLPMNE